QEAKIRIGSIDQSIKGALARREQRSAVAGAITGSPIRPLKLHFSGDEQNGLCLARRCLPPRRTGAVGGESDAVAMREELVQPRFKAVTPAERRVHPHEA